MLFDGVGGIDRDLIVSLVALFNTQVVILEVNIEVGVNEAVFDELPDDARHFVAIEFDHNACNLNLFHVLFPSPVPTLRSREKSNRISRCIFT